MTEQQKHELKLLVERLDAYQVALKLSDAEWCARYRKFIGTTKTWRDRMHGSASEELTNTAEKWIGRLRLLIGIFEGSGYLGDVYETPMLTKVRKGVQMLEGRHNDRRCYVVLAETGTGKTVAARALVKESLNDRCFVSALTHWRENKLAILLGLCEVLNCTPTAGGAGPAMNALKLVLRTSPKTIFIDEAHQGGVMLMRIIKDLINETTSRFVYLALRTEFVRVQGATSGSIVEARQFLGRCIRPICSEWANGCEVKDVNAYLKARLNGSENWSHIASATADAVRRNYNLRLLADAVDKAEEMADDEDRKISPMDVKSMVEELAAQN